MRPAPEGGGDEELMDPKMRKVGDALIALGRMKMAELRAKYTEVFGGDTTSHNAAFLRKKIAWRIQELAEGGVTERAKARIAALGRDAPLRERPPAVHGDHAPTSTATIAHVLRDQRLPPPGGVLRREYKGTVHEVTVAEGGFLYRGVTYASLSMVAKVITGTTWNGMLFFGLATRRRKEAA
ncbi:MAG TPA: DUF2924 domain-containing protein [Polyangiaceae bacterium]